MSHTSLGTILQLLVCVTAASLASEAVVSFPLQLKPEAEVTLWVLLYRFKPKILIWPLGLDAKGRTIFR